MYMNRNNLVIFLLIFLFCAFRIEAQVKKIDTTVKMGQHGFRIVCNNKDADKNSVTVSVIGLQTNPNKITFAAQGRLSKVLIDDFSDDGYPDLALCVYNGTDGDIGTIMGVSSENKELSPIYFPDIFLDPKLREGYKGHDEFSTVTGTILRTFPLYLPSDVPDQPTGGKRNVQYKAMKDEGRLTFKVLRTFDTKNK